MNKTRTLLLPFATLLPLCAIPAQTRRAVPQPQEFVTTQDDSLFSLTRSQEDVHEWEQARQDLQNGSVETAVERLHRVLQQEIGGTVAVGPNRFVGLRHALVLELANLPPAATAAYEALVRREAGALQDEDPSNLRSEQLRMLAERFPTAEVGRRARMRLGDQALEAGNGLLAASHFALLLQAAPIGSDLEQAAWSRQRCAAALVRSSSLRDGASLPDEVRDVLAVLPRSQDQTDWNAAGGGGDGSQPMIAPVGAPEPHFQDALQATGFEYGSGGSYAMHPTGGLDGIFVNTGLEVLALDPLRSELQWASLSPLREQSDARTIREYQTSVNPNMALAPALAGDVVVAVLQVPDESTSVRYQNAFMIMQRMPDRRLFAFQRSTGKILWSHFDGLGGAITQRYRGHSASGPPLIVGDTVYAPVHDRSGAIAFYVGAYDVKTGQPRWRRLVCSSQQEVNMFGNARQEFAASPLCASDGLVLGASNLGVCFAVERESGRLRWVTSYDVVRMPAAQLQGQESRTVFFQNSPPAVCDGVLCCTPLDSEHVLGLDVETGDMLWRIPHQAKANGNNDVRWLCGVLGDEFVLSGAGIVAVRARPEAPFQRTPPLRQIR
ncbi:MAG: PQQ-binding-like beta-propeller repeat protein, partial [Planctomycetota bacterium]